MSYKGWSETGKICWYWTKSWFEICKSHFPVTDLAIFPSARQKNLLSVFRDVFFTSKLWQKFPPPLNFFRIVLSGVMPFFSQVYKLFILSVNYKKQAILTQCMRMLYWNNVTRMYVFVIRSIDEILRFKTSETRDALKINNKKYN